MPGKPYTERELQEIEEERRKKRGREALGHGMTGKAADELLRRKRRLDKAIDEQTE